MCHFLHVAIISNNVYKMQFCTYILAVLLLFPAPRVGALSDDARLTSVCLTLLCLSRTSSLSREQRGLGRLKLAQR